MYQTLSAHRGGNHKLAIRGAKFPLQPTTLTMSKHSMQLNVQILSGSDTFHSERLQQEGLTEMLEEAAVVLPDD